ncbi:transcription factor TFIIB repeat domain-containing protein [Hirsutella rhossiliensis]|uniref:Transcription factor TFIIB repeat domain-containing protein n=1 Tax=Hirsutella rhossiliensis TaxID=111463 RepID=A0A9P8N811_9HYPO|nr:transcription factor TFIIB repeat domain-containing protein [Hirsutella rhossiliensis]KAH0968530.1 transcription factor TFIIB repeat domain-containing protein [Hirsutella rhossiliensis]
MSSLTPAKRPSQAGGLKPRFARPNPVRAMREREERRQAAVAAQQSHTSSASANRNGAVTAPARQQCPNKACPKPNVVDGTCQTCGRVADDSNIVAEVQFGETSSGAAIVQGSFVGADQAGVRSMGPAFRRVGGSEDREKSVREARGLMQGYAQQLSVSDSLVTAGTQVFKLASSANFIQGRTLASVAAVCLYAACRAQPPCKVMLIDLADLVQLNVFKLGRIFKKLNEVVPIGNDGLIPVYPEDLIWRFATKMEFHQDTAKVAEDAVRLVKRMSRDWMVMGRRPSGICGACLLMAARMHNFRRTVREVVYIVKVTNHTIQNRLQEFNFTESSKMSVEDFLKQDFLESSHDPPAFYRQSEEYQQMMEDKLRKRKRKADGEDNDGDNDDEGEGDAGQDGAKDKDAQQATARDEAEPAKRQRRAPEPGADLSKAPAIKFRRDADGFIIPPLPSQIQQDSRDAEADKKGDDNGEESLDRLVSEFGDALDDGLDAHSADRGNRPAPPQLPINEEWEQDEQELEGQIEEMFNDPLTYEHALAYSNAEQRARIHTTWALKQKPQKEVSMSADIGEDEFADDLEVLNCLLSPEEARIKELIWVNQNKDWLRKHQEKVFRRKMEADRPKQTRRRRKRARMGEGQTSPASSAAEAAINVAKDRAWSKRINYDAIRSIFEVPDANGLGSAATSRKTSVAGSTLGGADDDDENEEPAEGQPEEQGQDDEVEHDYEEPEYGGGEEFGGGGGEFEGGYEDYDNPDMDAEYGLDDD